jgi:hypothetical protein
MPEPTFSKILWALSFATLCFGTSVASASPTYPGTLADALDVPCAPKCTLCQTRPTGGFATVNTPFGLTVRMQHGLECCDPALLRDVLDEIRQEETDSDDDGVSDIDELQVLTDPNTSEDIDLACEPSAEDSGCSVSNVGAARQTLPSALVVAGILIVLAAARRFA